VHSRADSGATQQTQNYPQYPQSPIEPVSGLDQGDNKGHTASRRHGDGGEAGRATIVMLCAFDGHSHESVGQTGPDGTENGNSNTDHMSFSFTLCDDFENDDPILKNRIMKCLPLT